MNEALLNEIKRKYEVGAHLLFAMMPYLEDAAKDINSKELKQPPTDEELRSYVNSLSPLELAALIVFRCPAKKTVKFEVPGSSTSTNLESQFGTIDPLTGKTMDPQARYEVERFGGPREMEPGGEIPPTVNQTPPSMSTMQSYLPMRKYDPDKYPAMNLWRLGRSAQNLETAKILREEYKQIPPQMYAESTLTEPPPLYQRWEEYKRNRDMH